VWAPTLLCGVALAVAELGLAYFLPTFLAEAGGRWLQLPFVRNLLRGLLGAELGEAIGPSAIPAIAWAHPIVLALSWTHAITLGTRFPAGEVDRGTIDVLLSLPISRTSVFVSDVVVCLAAGAVVVAMGLAGNTLARSLLAPELRPTGIRTIVIAVNLYCLYVAVAGVTWLGSASSRRRGRAIAAVLAVVFAAFLLSFLAQFSPLARRVAFLSVLNYYRPLLTIRDASWPIRDLTVLLATGALLWLAAAIVLSRRDL
jgi:ABC-2 type transport system permease protein